MPAKKARAARKSTVQTKSSVSEATIPTESQEPIQMRLLKKATGQDRGHTVPKDALTGNLSTKDLELLRRMGTTTSSLTELMYQATAVNYERESIYREIDRCLAGDTVVPLLDGTLPTIQEIVENLDQYVGRGILSVNPDTLQIEPDTIVHGKMMGVKEVIEVILDNDEVVTCTPDHRFLLRDGTYREAQDLTPGASLMPLYTKLSEKGLPGYQMVFNPRIGKYTYTHKMVSEFHDGVRPKGSVIHHKDFDKLNNDPSNLEQMRKKDHIDLHGAHSRGKPGPWKNNQSDPRFLAGRQKFKDGMRSGRLRIWNKGLTKGSSSGVQKISNALRRHYEQNGTRPRTEDEKLRISLHSRSGNPDVNEKRRTSLRKTLRAKTKVERTPAHVAKWMLSARDFWKSEEGKKRQKEHLEAQHLARRLRHAKQYEWRHCVCGKVVVVPEDSRFHACAGHARMKPKETRICACGCGQSFVVPSNSKVQYVRGHNRRFAVVNHKVKAIHHVRKNIPVYDIQTARNHNFPVDAGVFVHNCLTHPIMSACVELFADTATTYDSIHGATVWVTSDNSKYTSVLTKLFETLAIEERIYDWAWTLSAYGDVFGRINAIQGTGVISMEDDLHPGDVSRLDSNGRLLGFYQTPLFGQQSTELRPPWEYVHFRLLGAKKRRPAGDKINNAMEYTTVRIMAPDQRRLTTKYGSSVLLNGLPVYKRLRLAEDSILIARLSKGITRYIWKVVLDSTNAEAVASLIDDYKTLLKRARALDTSAGAPFFEEHRQEMAVNEDVIIPVWGDSNNVTTEKVGGEVDIRWIRDIEELRNQLASALRTPLQLLGGYTKEMPQGLGRGAIERYDVRFARQARRIQRALIEGITRICQIHLAHLGMDPSTDLFTVCMADTSSAEEEELKDSLDKGTDVVSKLVELVTNTLGEENVDRLETLKYFGDTVLRLQDFDPTDFLRKDLKDQAMAERKKTGVPEKAKQLAERKRIKLPHLPYTGSDTKAMLPVWDRKNRTFACSMWETTYRGTKLVSEKIGENTVSISVELPTKQQEVKK